MKLKETNEIFADDLRDPAYAAGYLNVAFEEDGIEGFLYALQKVARVHGVSKVAKSSDIPRESLYRALTKSGNPGIKPLSRVLEALSLRMTITPTLAETGSDPSRSSLEIERSKMQQAKKHDFFCSAQGERGVTQSSYKGRRLTRVRNRPAPPSCH